MTQEQFESTLRTHLRREPYVPFVVALLDGRRIVIDEPAVAYNGRTAVFLTEEYGLVDFSSAQVVDMELLTPVRQS